MGQAISEQLKTEYGVPQGGILSPLISSISIKDFVREKKSATKKKERATETLNLKLNTKPLKFKCGLADGGGGWAGWSTHARHGYPHLVYNIWGRP